MKWGNGSTTKPSVSSQYGDGRGGTRTHAGTDFVGHSDLYAIASGTVTKAGYFNAAAGHAVVIDSVIDGQAVTICRFHVADGSITVKVGERVEAGQHIGKMGATGNASGKCDHVEIRFWKGGSYTTVNPETWLPAKISSSAFAETVPVKTYQAELIRLGYDLGSWGADGIKGAKTAAALKAWQGANGLAADGLFGPLSKAKMFPAPAPAPAAPAAVAGRTTADFGRVDVVQRALKTKYPLYASGLVIDNVDGPRTKAAVREFQRRAGLTVDGVAGPATRKALGV